MSLADLSARHDVRPLVLRTLLTYLELLGVLRQGTPFYAAYGAKPLEPLDAIFSRVSGEPRLRFTRLSSADSRDTLVPALLDRFERREAQEIARLQLVLALVAEPGCQTAALVGYFGETLPGPCGHCTPCLTPDAPRIVPPGPALSPIATRVAVAAFVELCAAHPAALREPRQQAGFLCGLTSPALTSARRSRYTLFGALEQYPFSEVLAWSTDQSHVLG